MESMAEYLDVELAGRIFPEEFMQRINPQLPSELKVLAAQPLPERHASISQQSQLFSYRVELPVTSGQNYEDHQVQLKEFLSRSSILIEAATKTGTKVKDIRPMINSLKLAPKNGCLRLELILTPGVRPQEVVQELYGVTAAELGLLSIMRIETFDQTQSPILRSNINATGNTG